MLHNQVPGVSSVRACIGGVDLSTAFISSQSNCSITQPGYLILQLLSFLKSLTMYFQVDNSFEIWGNPLKGNSEAGDDRQIFFNTQQFVMFQLTALQKYLQVDKNILDIFIYSVSDVIGIGDSLTSAMQFMRWRAVSSAVVCPPIQMYNVLTSSTSIQLLWLIELRLNRYLSFLGRLVLQHGHCHCFLCYFVGFVFVCLFCFFNKELFFLFSHEEDKGGSGSGLSRQFCIVRQQSMTLFLQIWIA